jgi:hypothetical protein
VIASELCAASFSKKEKHSLFSSTGLRFIPLSPSSASAPSALPIAVEVELTLKSTQELVAILSAWADCRYIEAALYFAETVQIEEKLMDMIDELKIEDWVVVNPLSEVVKELAGFELGDGL